ncbi:MAG: hypothetical protein MUC49_01615 [Raineya sp.]|jgi:hypothetical protein|nr:hypothetical protein [Raineya sp.]
MEKFIIGENDFGVGKISYKVNWDKDTIDLTIEGNTVIFEQLSESKAWNWALYPPKIYFRNVSFEFQNATISIIIDEQMLDEYDIALYFLEHNDIEGILTIDEDNIFSLEGFTYISGEKMNLEMEVKLIK